MFKVWVVAKREYLALVSTKSFWLGLLAPPFMGLMAVLIALGGPTDDRARAERVLLLDHSERVGKTFKHLARAQGFVVVEPAGSAEGAGDAASWSERLRRGELAAVVRVPRSLQTGEPVFVFVENVAASSARQLEAMVRETIQVERLLEAGLSERQVSILKRPVDIQTGRATAALTPEPAGATMFSLLIPMITLVFTMMGVASGAVPLLQAVVEEKQQRIAEVLLGAVSPLQLMLGKLLGTTSAGATVLACNLGTGVLTMLYLDLGKLVPVLALALAVSISLLAMLMFGALFLAIGSVTSELKEAQGLLLPVMLVFVAPAVALPNLTEAPNSWLSVLLSLFPMTAPLAMPVRMAVTQAVPLWQVGLAFALVVLATAAAIWAAGRVFRIGMLSQGRVPSLGQLWRWVIDG